MISFNTTPLQLWNGKAQSRPSGKQLLIRECCARRAYPTLCWHRTPCPYWWTPSMPCKVWTECLPNSTRGRYTHTCTSVLYMPQPVLAQKRPPCPMWVSPSMSYTVQACQIQIEGAINEHRWSHTCTYLDHHWSLPTESTLSMPHTRLNIMLAKRGCYYWTQLMSHTSVRT